VIELTPHPEGVILPVRAQPGSRKQGVVDEHAGALKVAVSAAPEHGKANKALIELLSKVLGVKRSQIELVAGDTSQDKRFLIRGLPLEKVGEQLRLALGGQ
jgi:uncharacterized protein (TIGR00251 family)